MSSLTKAMNLEEQGKNPKTIWQETGFKKDVYGRWRFEINDKDATLSRSGLRKLGTNFEGGAETAPTFDHVKLGDLLKHDQLYKLYPELKDLPVVPATGTTIGSAYGQYRPGKDSHIRMNMGLFSNPKEFGSTLIHEVQHAVQDKMGMLAMSKAADVHQNFTKLLVDREVELENMKNPSIEAIRQKEEITRALDKWATMTTTEKDNFIQMSGMYRHSPIETEAWDTSARKGLTEAERLAKFPDQPLRFKWSRVLNFLHLIHP